MKRIALFSLLLLVAACEGERPRPTGTRPGDAGEVGADVTPSDGAIADASAGDAGTTSVPAGACPASTLTTFPLDVTGDSSTASSEFEASCAGAGGSPDLAVVWTAPQNARYRFTTEGSAYDTVLTILNGSCAGPELACADDIDGTNVASEASLSLTAGQTITVIIDGLNAQESGAFRLQINFD
jgi:hypothetical protein